MSTQVLIDTANALIADKQSWSTLNHRAGCNCAALERTGP